jgi:hypothetical protein
MNRNALIIAAGNAYAAAIEDCREISRIAAEIAESAAARVDVERADANARAARLLVCRIEKHITFGGYENIPAIAAAVSDLLSSQIDIYAVC